MRVGCARARITRGSVSRRSSKDMFRKISFDDRDVKQPAPGGGLYPSVATSVARFRSWSPSALLIGPEATAEASIESSTSDGERHPARVLALGLDLEHRRALAPAVDPLLDEPPRRVGLDDPDGHRLAHPHRHEVAGHVAVLEHARVSDLVGQHPDVLVRVGDPLPHDLGRGRAGRRDRDLHAAAYSRTVR